MVFADAWEDAVRSPPPVRPPAPFDEFNIFLFDQKRLVGSLVCDADMKNRDSLANGVHVKEFFCALLLDKRVQRNVHP